MVEKNVTHLRVSKSFKDRVDRMRGNLSTAKFLDMVDMIIGDQKQIREKKRDAAMFEQLNEIRQRLDSIENTIQVSTNKELSPVWQTAIQEIIEARRIGDSSNLSSISHLIIEEAEKKWIELGYDEHYGSPLDPKLDVVFDKIINLAAAILEYNTSLGRQSINQNTENEVFVSKDG